MYISYIVLSLFNQATSVNIPTAKQKKMALNKICYEVHKKDFSAST